MWRVAVISVTTIIGYVIGTQLDSPGVSSLVGFVVGMIISFPQIIGEIAEGAIDCID